MPHWRTHIEKDFLGAWDLVAADGKTPKDYTLKVARVKSQLLKTREHPKGKRKCTIQFVGARKAMVANATNCETIEAMYGPDTDAWVGKLVTLYQTDVRNPNGGTIRGIRVRPRKPQGHAETLVESPVDQAMRDEQEAAFGREESERGDVGPTRQREPGED
jgi:hypothetical protein